MSNIFVMADLAAAWQKPVLSGLLALSLVLSVLWLVRVSMKRGQFWPRGEIQDRPQLPEVALAAVSLALLASLWAWLLKGIVESQNLELALAGALGELCTCLLILSLLGWKAPKQLDSFGLVVRGWPKHVGWGLVWALAVWPIAIQLLLPLSLRAAKSVSRWAWQVNYTAQPHTLLREMSEVSAPLNVWLLVILAVVIAPLAEEILFRGLLQGALVRLLRSRWIAIVITAAIFSVLHLVIRENVAAGESSLAQVETIPSLFLLGLALGYSYEKTRSLYRPMVIHLAFNALSLIMVWPQLPWAGGH